MNPLAPAEQLYGVLYRRRRRRVAATLPEVHSELRRQLGSTRVISVGNITAGGTGKTPAVQYIARTLEARGLRVAIVARGYGGTYSASGAVVSDGKALLLNAEQGGDEPVLHARTLPAVPVVIGSDRVAAVRLALERFQPAVVLLDDGFQYWSVPRDLDLVLLDARRPFDNGHLLPRGRLREPPDELRRADALLLTRCDLATPAQLEAARVAIGRYSTAPLFDSVHASAGVRDEATGAVQPLDALQGKAVALASALADNAAFAHAVERCGAPVVAHLARRDHHRWTERELRDLSKRASAAGAQVLVTTEKDAVKMSSSWCEPLPLWSLRIALQPLENEQFDSMLQVLSNLNQPAASPPAGSAGKVP